MNKEILKNISYGMYIISSCDNEKLYGCIANSMIQINSETLAISLNKNNDTTKAILNSKNIGITILDENTNMDLIKTFGFQKSSIIDKYANLEYEIIDKVPIIKGKIGYITASLVNYIDIDTHYILIVKITAMKKENDLTPMTYKYYQEIKKGLTNPSAPTYQENNISKTSKHVFVCTICGYKYETDLEELPEDFKCPVCGVGKEYFKKLQ